MSPPRLLVVHCPSWPAISLGSVAGRALAVLERGRVLAVSPGATAAGVAIGQRRREAMWNCPLLEVVRRDEGAERRAFAPALGALERFGAPITLRAPGWAWIATRGPARYFGGEAALALAVTEALRGLGGEWAGGEGLRGGCFSIGVGDGVFVATKAAERAMVVAHEETPRFLDPLPLESLGRPDLADLLAHLGIRTVGEFSRLTEEDVLARFGWDGARAHRVARGEEEGEPSPPPSQDVEREVVAEIDPPAGLVDEVVLVARALAEELCGRLGGEGLVFSLLRITVETASGEECTRRWSHDGPYASALVVERVRWQLEGSTGRQHADETSQLVGGAVLLRLGAEEITPDRGRQGGFWERSRAPECHVIQAFARVQGMLGPSGVLQGSVVGGRGPIERIELHPFGDRPPSTVRPADRPWPGQIPPPSPALVYDPPPPIAVEDHQGHSIRVDGRGELSAAPATVEVDGVTRSVTAWAGPWPVDERWWDVARRRRARFQLVVGEEVYLVALDRGRFVLEGKYD